MAGRNINRDTALAVKLLELRRHLKICYACRAAMKNNDPSGMCPISSHAILEIAMRWDGNIAGRLAGAKSKDGIHFLCPEPNAHGPAYAVSAEAVRVVAHQDGLF